MLLTINQITTQPLDQEMIDNITSAMVDNTSVTKLDMCNCAVTDESIDVSFNCATSFDFCYLINDFILTRDQS